MFSGPVKWPATFAQQQLRHNRFGSGVQGNGRQSTFGVCREVVVREKISGNQLLHSMATGKSTADAETAEEVLTSGRPDLSRPPSHSKLVVLSSRSKCAPLRQQIRNHCTSNR